MSGGKRRGFTMVELLMVIVIIGLLMALLLAAVNSSRESSRRAACLHRMREVAGAVAQFEDKRNHYPGWRHNPFRGRDAITDRPITFSTSWFAQLLPYIGRNDVYGGEHKGTLRYPYVFGGPGGTPRYRAPPMNDLLVCPSDQEKMASDLAELSYVGNAGRRDERATTSVPADWRANGVFLNLLAWRGDPSNRVMFFRTDTSYIRGGDGLATTLLLAKNLDAGRWHQINEAAAGFIFYPPGANPQHRINGPGVPKPPAFLSARPSSNHPGGVNVVFTDGHGRFVREDMDYVVYCALMTPHGRYAKEPGSNQASAATITNPPKLTADAY